MTGLPQGWATITIGEASGVGGLSTDGDWIESKDQDPTGSVRLIQLQDIGDGSFVNKSSRFLTEQKAEELNCTFLSPGDVLIARMPDPLGRACRFPDIGQKSVTAVDVHVWRKGEHGVDPDFLVYCVNSPEIRQSLQAQASGTTRQRVSGGRLKAQDIPLPPLPEQRRIVRKLDTLTARSTTARTHLTAIEKLVERYKLAEIGAQIGSRSDQRQMIRDVASVQLGKMLDQAKNQGADVEYLANINVRWFSFRLDELKLIRATDEDIHKYAIQDGDLIVCEGGEPGRAAIWCGGNTNIIIQKALMRVRCSATMDPRYLLLWIYWMASTQRLEIFFTGTTIKHLPKRALEVLEVPVPTIEQQREIVGRIETAFAKIDHLAAEAAKALKLLGHLDQRILAKAFAGELVPQDPSDEPADALLARIRETRAVAPKARRGRKAKQ